MFSFFKRRRPKPSFEQQFATLAACGIRLAEGVEPDSLFDSHDREQYEAEPYFLLLMCMGNIAEYVSQDSDTGYLSNDIWHFDAECIEDHGAYVEIARRMSDLAQGELPLEDIADFVDIEAGRAHLSFNLAGQPYHWEAEVDDDWADPNILTRLAELLERLGDGRRFTCIDLGGQDCLIGCATADERERLAREIGSRVDWLE